MAACLIQNIYSSLDTPSVPQTECPTRKAKKKLREIEKLKKKSKLTTEEYAKIHEEENWKAIAFPVNITIQTPEEIGERKLKQREKTIQKLEKQLADEKEKHKKDIQKHKKEIQFLRDKHNSLEHINAQLKHDLKTLIENQDRFSRAQPKHAANAPPESFEEKLEEEFLEISRENKSHKKAYIAMMLAYHPDKLGDKDIANKASKCINELKEKYPF